MELKTKEIYGFEALIRWNHPKYGPISPGVFIPIIEGTVHIHPLTYWIIDQAFSRLQTMHEQGYLHSIAINLTVYNFYDPDFIQKLLFYSDKYNVDPKYVEFEVTENTMIEDIDNIIQVMNKIKELGFKLVIDDFGTGYSSLTYLKKLPVDVLKIDIYFIKNILLDMKDQALVEWIIQVSHLYQLRVVAEGIESQEVLDKLLELGCDYGQGFHIARPIPPNEEFLRLCKEGMK